MPKVTPDTATKDKDTNMCGPYEALLFSDSGGLTQFGAFLEILPPGSSSALKHWHQVEDEMVYMIAGVVTVTEGEDSYELRPGEAATFKAGAPLGHCVENTGTCEARYLVIGTRSTGDTVTYPDHDRILKFTREAGASEVATRSFTTLDGSPNTSPYEEK